MDVKNLIENFVPQDVGFKCGLEVHQQLLTKEKLFCKCPAGLYSDHYDAQVLRHMRPTLSELGEYDGTALMEFKTKKDIIYRLNKESVCTYEMDDNPPFLINEEAVDIAIEIALLFNCSIVGELHVARKQYLDGSIPAGFQRTAIVGLNGWIPYKGRKITVIQLSLEEDACREVSDQGHLRVYTTDRLSMPLIEVVTGPDMLTPDEVAEVGWIIGETMRITNKVRRGIGSVRQDVNVSVTGGTRVEIKGVPRIPLFPPLVFHEAFRQHQLLNLRDEMHIRGITNETLKCERFAIKELLFHPAFAADKDKEFSIGCAVLKGMRGLLSFPMGPNRTFADEIAGRVKVIACLESRPVLLHTDDSGEGGLPSRDRELIKSITNMTAEDTAVIVWGPKSDVETALNEIEIRCREATEMIPNETRQVLKSAETEFERILPGPDRMYPDTDSPPLAISEERVKQIESQLPERPCARRARLENMGLSTEQINAIIVSPYFGLFDEVVKEKNVSPKIAAYVLTDLVKFAQRRIDSNKKLSPAMLKSLFQVYNERKLHREFFRRAIKSYLKEPNEEGERIYAKLYDNANDDVSISQVIDVMNVNERPKSSQPDAQMRFYMGKAMQHFGGLLNPTEVLKEILSHLRSIMN